MEINGKPPIYTSTPHTQSNNDAQGGVASKSDEFRDKDTKDTVDLSSDANEIKEMVKKVNDLPDVRTDKVAEMKRRIAAGTYEIMNEKAASHLIGEAVENNAILNRIDPRDD